jgi:hypothetical protein
MAGANKRVTELTVLSTPTNNDVLPIVDVLDTTQDPTGSLKQITWASLKTAILAFFSAGTGIIYAVTRDGEMRWYRHRGWFQGGGLETWEPQDIGYRVVGRGLPILGVEVRRVLRQSWQLDPVNIPIKISRVFRTFVGHSDSTSAGEGHGEIGIQGFVGSNHERSGIEDGVGAQP